MAGKKRVENPDYLEKISRFCLFDDDFMSVIFKKKELAELLLRVILGRTDLTVRSVQPQYDVKNLNGRSVRLDILAVDSNDRIYNIEVQRDDRFANPERARLNSSLLDASCSTKGAKKVNLPETYIIFITEHDYFKRGKPLYRVERLDVDSYEPFGDGSHIVYVNGENRDDTDLGRLMADFSCSDPDKYNYKELAEEARYYKHSEKGVRSMCKIMEDVAMDAAKARSEQVALKMLADGKLSVKDIAKYSGLTVNEVKALAKKKPA